MTICCTVPNTRHYSLTSSFKTVPETLCQANLRERHDSRTKQVSPTGSEVRLSTEGHIIRWRTHQFARSLPWILCGCPSARRHPSKTRSSPATSEPPINGSMAPGTAGSASTSRSAHAICAESRSTGRLSEVTAPHGKKKSMSVTHHSRPGAAGLVIPEKGGMRWEGVWTP